MQKRLCIRREIPGVMANTHKQHLLSFHVRFLDADFYRFAQLVVYLSRFCKFN